jgi:hypothetical protein
MNTMVRSSTFATLRLAFAVCVIGITALLPSVGWGLGSNGTENPGKRTVLDAGTDSEELWNGLKRGISDSAGLQKRIANELSRATPFCN